MRTIEAFIKSHPVLTYFVLTFAISWGGLLLVIGGPGRILGTSEKFDMLLPFVILALLAGPSVSGILTTALVDGKAGFREFQSRLVKWRVGIRWYAIALLVAPLLIMAIYLMLSANGYRNRADGRHLRGTWLDRFCHTPVEAALQCPCHWPYRGFSMGCLAHTSCPLVGIRQRHGQRHPIHGQLFDRPPPIPDGLQGTHGVGLRPY